MCVMSQKLIMLLLCKTLAAPTGEMLRPLAAPQSFFETERGKLRGMNETIEKINVKKEYQGYQQEIKQRVYEIANVAQVPSTEAGTYVHMNILQLFYRPGNHEDICIYFLFLFQAKLYNLSSPLER